MIEISIEGVEEDPEPPELPATACEHCDEYNGVFTLTFGPTGLGYSAWGSEDDEALCAIGGGVSECFGHGPAGPRYVLLCLGLGADPGTIRVRLEAYGCLGCPFPCHTICTWIGDVPCGGVGAVTKTSSFWDNWVCGGWPPTVIITLS